ncbi:MAG: tetratricopeptide repeat protein [Gammaproteobacteria bacterium]|nr:tetratricopeptide repeat protein [Gammaproteobacteria bacterium]
MSDIEERLRKAKALLEEGHGTEARIDLLELLKDDANNPAALLMLGGSYFYDKKFAEAEMVYQRLILAEPGSGMLSIALFNSLWNQNRYDEAAEEIRRFISVADKDQERETLEKYAEIVKAIADQN